MIGVERAETAAAAQDVEALLAALEGRPGFWMGCDVASEGLYRKESIACAVPALRFCLDGATLAATALTPAGGGLLAAFGPRTGKHESGAAVLAELRRFLALFGAPSPEVGFYGAFAFDYFRLGRAEPLPEDGHRRFVLYFPERVLVAGEHGARWIDFAFSCGTGGTGGPIAPARVDEARDELAPGEHARRVAGGIERLKRGELQSLVLSQAFRRRTGAAPARAFAALRARNPYPAMFFANLGGGEILFGASPDLQLRADAAWVESAPVCGTLRRGTDPVEDMGQAFALLASEKEGAAIALCADAAANEHAEVCVPGTVEVLSHRRPYFFSTIIHAIDHLRGRRRAGLDAFDLLLAHATPATVTGLPKRDAVRAIGELEGGWRGWYAGAVARLGTDGSVEAYTVLRAARIAGGVAEIRCGGNILVDSDPEKEEDESRLKAQTLFRVLETAGAEIPPGATPAKGWACQMIESGDADAPRLANALAAAGALEGAAGIRVLSGPLVSPRAPDAPLLAVGEGAVWLLERDGARPERLPRPEFARAIAGHAEHDGFLSELCHFQAGWYATHAFRAGTLPANWRESAISQEGWVLAAQRADGGACALLFRPDSVLSLHGASGKRALQAAFAWLEHGMFAADLEKETA